MYKSTSEITDISRELCRTLSKKEQTIPQDTLFRDDLFDETCRKIQDRNEIMIIRDIGLLIVSSAQTLTIYDATHLNHLYETTNEGWNSVFSFPLHKTRLLTRTSAIVAMTMERQKKQLKAIFCRVLVLALRRMMIEMLTTSMIV